MQFIQNEDQINQSINLWQEIGPRHSQAIELLVAIPKVLWIRKPIDGSNSKRFVRDACPCHSIGLACGKTGSNTKNQPSHKGVLESFHKLTPLITIGNIGATCYTLKTVARVLVITELNSRRDVIINHKSSRFKPPTRSG